MATGKKSSLNVTFESNNTSSDEVISHALLTQLMATITQIGIRIDNPESNSDDIIKKETNHEKTN